MRNRYFDRLHQAVNIAEEIYDQVIRRWGNIQFAQSTVYDWVWSDEFQKLCYSLSELEQGSIRLHIMALFGVKPWPWFRRQHQMLQKDMDLR